MQRVARLVGKPILTQLEFDEHSKFSYATLRDRLGGWKAALERAGLGHLYSAPILRPRAGCMDEDLLEEVRRVAGLVSKPVLTMEDFRRHSEFSTSTLRKRFGGWSETLRRAGLERLDFQLVVQPVIGYPDEVMLDEVRRVAALVDKPVLSCQEFGRHSTINPETIRLRFGGWRSVLELAGVGYRYCRHVKGARRKRTDEELLAEVRRVAGIVDKRTLTTLDFKNHSKLSVHRLAQRFGGWENLLRRAGLEHRLSIKLAGFPTAERLLCLIRQFATQTDPSEFSLANFKSETGITIHVIRRLFGGWENAVLVRTSISHHTGVSG